MKITEEKQKQLDRKVRQRGEDAPGQLAQSQLAEDRRAIKEYEQNAYLKASEEAFKRKHLLNTYSQEEVAEKKRLAEANEKIAKLL